MNILIIYQNTWIASNAIKNQNYFKSIKIIEYFDFLQDTNTSNELNDIDIVWLNVNIRNFQKTKDSIELVYEKIDSLKKNIQVVQNNYALPQHSNYLEVLEENKNLRIKEETNSNFHVLDIFALASDIGGTNWFSEKYWYMSKIPVCPKKIDVLFTSLIKTVDAKVKRRIKKCIVLDLDNTVWGGVIGDDGVKGINLGTGYLGEVYLDIQKYLKSLMTKGLLLSINTKNSIENVTEGINHPESQFEMSDFVSIKANWQPKNENILDISKDLNLGLDSFVFIDDNPFERNIVRESLPSVTVVELTSNPEDFVNLIKKDLNVYLDTHQNTTEDLKRNSYYSQDKKRNELKKTFKNYEEYLKSINMIANFGKVKNEHVSRVSQLTQRTNQFNLTNLRLTEQDIHAMIKDNKYVCIFGRISDRFGDNGITTCIIGKLKDDTCEILSWVMSCRVFSRSFEFETLRYFLTILEKKNIFNIKSSYNASKKNVIVSKLYDNLNFNETYKDNNEKKYICCVKQIKIPKTTIEVIYE